MTVVVALAELFARLGSDSAAETLAEEESTPAAGPGVTTTAMLDTRPTARLGRVQVTTPPDSLHVQPEPPALLKTTPAGTVWETDRELAALGPLLETLSV